MGDNQNWYELHSLANPQCYTHVKNLCDNYFKFFIYNITRFDGRIALYLGCNNESYVIYPDEKKPTLKVLEYNSRTDTDFPYNVKEYLGGEDCWKECLADIKTAKF